MKLKFVFSCIVASLTFSLSAVSINCVSYTNYGQCNVWFADGKYYSSYPNHLLNQSQPQKPQVQSVPVESKFEVPVIVLVSTKNDGKGNEKWRDKKYVEAVLARSSAIGSNVVFKLKSLSVIKGSGFIKVDGEKIFNSASQLPALNFATSKAAGGHIVIAISGEKTKSSSGLAWVGYRSKPVFAMRSRFNGSDAYTAKAIDNTAGIFVHELGHNFGLSHGGEIHTDNYSKKEKGLILAAKYFRSLTGKQCKKISVKGLCVN